MIKPPAEIAVIRPLQECSLEELHAGRAPHRFDFCVLARPVSSSSLASAGGSFDNALLRPSGRIFRLGSDRPAGPSRMGFHVQFKSLRRSGHDSDTVRWVTSQLHHLRDGAAHPRLQSDPRHEHHGKQAAPRQDQCRNSGTYAANCDNGTGTDPTPTPSREARSSTHAPIGNPAQELLEHSRRPQARRGVEHRHDLAVEYFGQGIGDAVAARGLLLRRQTRIAGQPAAGRGRDGGLNGRRGHFCRKIMKSPI